ncbi:DUF599 domain-containing protein [Cognatishimia sp. F0-27]|uniref:DUF599 domain-containing protein n=1 Tax=Cognatishimia sp. F0-27 TaxID=2816855 RepID=UPI001D0CBCDC|nr:DUF599 domain-containing protein [Cognatishimia sp. F0-27]MCC1491013.1 DUF599 domain-containing protein [Cognatishimia sp. F0-27]
MTSLDTLTLLAPVDYAALAVLIGAWLGATLLVEHPPRRRVSVSVLMADMRRDWMQEMVTRDPRIFDSQIVGQLRQGAAFFASASMIAIGGGFALLGNADRLQTVADDLALSGEPLIVWEIKLLLLLLFSVNAFLKFVWSHRLFGYSSVMMAAVPNDPQHPDAPRRARQAAEVNILAARGFNRGLRSVYFGIAAAAWLVGASALLAAAVFTLGVILRREFASQTRAVLLSERDGRQSTQT